MTNQELIEIAKSLDISPDNASLYEFVNKYIENRRNEADQTDMTSESILDVINSLENYCKTEEIIDENIKAALGVVGKKRTQVKNWCESIKNSKELLKVLSVDELRYVMAMAFRLCKIANAAENTSSINNSDKRNNNKAPKYDPQYLQTESKTVLKPKVYYCQTCKKKNNKEVKLELTEEQMISAEKGYRVKNVKCPYGHSNMI